MKLLDNPFFTTVALLFAPWIAIPALIIKHWQPIMDFFTKIINTVGGAIQKVGDFFQGGGTTGQSSNPYQRRGLVGGNDASIQRTETTNRTALDVNFNNAPPGTTTRRRGTAPGITLNTGFGGGRL